MCNELLHLAPTGAVVAESVSRLRIRLDKFVESRSMKSYKKVLEMDVPSDNPNSAAVDAGGILGRMGCRMWPKLWIISK